MFGQRQNHGRLISQSVSAIGMHIVKIGQCLIRSNTIGRGCPTAKRAVLACTSLYDNAMHKQLLAPLANPHPCALGHTEWQVASLFSRSKRVLCPGGGGVGRQLPPQLTVGQRALGGVLGGARGGGVSRGGGGASEQLGMRPRCDPTVRTAPSHNRSKSKSI